MRSKLYAKQFWQLWRTLLVHGKDCLRYRGTLHRQGNAKLDSTICWLHPGLVAITQLFDRLWTYKIEKVSCGNKLVSVIMFFWSFPLLELSFSLLHFKASRWFKTGTRPRVFHNFVHYKIVRLRWPSGSSAMGIRWKLGLIFRQTVFIRDTENRCVRVRGALYTSI